MSSKPRPCIAIEDDLIAAATGDAAGSLAKRVDEHVARCNPCREEYARFRAVDAVVAELRAAPAPSSESARERVLARLSDLRSRLAHYSVLDSPLGPILIAATETGVALVEYLGRRGVAGSWLLQQAELEPHAGGAELARFGSELIDYLAGGRTRLDWPLDLRLATSDFQRAVLEATAGVPYGAVSSYAGIAHHIGKPSAVRAVAQALRHNPLPIVLPCHRIIGSAGALVGYSGNRVGLKQRLLGIEGVRTEQRHRDVRVDRRAMYAWDRSDREYCLPTCGDISSRPIGRVTLFASSREAQALGLRPCRDCRPDLHPL
jgi:O-6-methylguanine DNA methyltransferase